MTRQNFNSGGSQDTSIVTLRICDGGSLGLEVCECRCDGRLAVEIVAIEQHSAADCFNRLLDRNDPRRLTAGDVILEANGVQGSHGLMQELQSSTMLTLRVLHGGSRRDADVGSDQFCSAVPFDALSTTTEENIMCRNNMQAPFEVTLRIMDGGALGLQIRESDGGKTPGFEIIGIDDGGAAECFNRLLDAGDQRRIDVGGTITEVNGHRELASMMTAFRTQATLTMLIKPGVSQAFNGCDISTSGRPNRSENCILQPTQPQSASGPQNFRGNASKSPKSGPRESVACPVSPLECQKVTMRIMKGGSLGLQISPFQGGGISGFEVCGIDPLGAAESFNRLLDPSDLRRIKVGDVIVEVNGVHARDQMAQILQTEATFALVFVSLSRSHEQRMEHDIGPSVCTSPASPKENEDAWITGDDLHHLGAQFPYDWRSIHDNWSARTYCGQSMQNNWCANAVHQVSQYGPALRRGASLDFAVPSCRGHGTSAPRESPLHFYGSQSAWRGIPDYSDCISPSNVVPNLPSVSTDDFCQVVLRIVDGGAVGLEVCRSCDGVFWGLEVLSMDPRGAAECFNRLLDMESARRIRIGDLIVEVNGVREPAEMMEMLHRSSKLNIIFKHCTSHQDAVDTMSDCTSKGNSDSEHSDSTDVPIEESASCADSGSECASTESSARCDAVSPRVVTEKDSRHRRSMLLFSFKPKGRSWVDMMEEDDDLDDSEYLL